MNTVYHIVEVAHTDKGFPITSVMRSFSDGTDRFDVWKTGEEKANEYLRYLEDDTKDRTFEVTESYYGR